MNTQEIEQQATAQFKERQTTKTRPETKELWTDGDLVWKVTFVGKYTVEAICNGLKKPFGLGEWWEEFSPFTDEDINERWDYLEENACT